MSKFGWRRGNPSTFIPVGDVGEATKWLPYARVRLEAMMNSLVAAPTDLQPYRRRTYCPADGVIITLESLHGIPRITIETGLLCITVGFENNELVIKAAAEFNLPFLHKLTLTPESGFPAWDISSVGGFLNLGEGQAMFVAGRTSLSIGYVVTLSETVTAKPIIALANVDLEKPHVGYIGRFPDGKRLVNVPYEPGFGFRRPRLTVFTADNILLANMQFPLPAGHIYGTPPVTILRPIVSMGLGRAMMLVRVSDSPVRYYRLYTTDGGMSWEYLAPGLFETFLEAATLAFEAIPDTFKLAPLPGGRAIITGLANPNYPAAGDRSIVAFISPDRGLSFTGPYAIRPLGVDQLMFESISLGGDKIGMLTVTDVGDVCLSRSDDAGITWVELPPIAPGIATLISSIRTVGNVVLLTPTVLGVGVYEYADLTYYLYISKDFGETWTRGQVLGATATSRDFYVALRIGTPAGALPANPAIPDLYDLV